MEEADRGDREPFAAAVESLGLKRCCFSSALSLQLCLDLPGCPELLYLAVLGGVLCCVPLAPNFSFNCVRLENTSFEKQFRWL